MSNQITTAMKQQYNSNVKLLLQQKGSLLSPAVMTETQDSEFQYYDQVGQTVAQRSIGRHQDTQYVNTPHERRRVGLVDYDWADLIDRSDKLRTAADFTSPYVQNAAYALGRAQDDEIINAFFGPAFTGKDGTNVVNFPGSQVVAVNSWKYGTGTGNAGLTVSKLIEARSLVRKAQVDPSEELHIAVTADKLSDLLATTLVTSNDFNNVKALVEGEITRFMGLNFHVIERLLLDANGFVRIPVWCKSGIVRAVGQDITTEIDRLPGKRYSTQIFASQSIGATRMEEKKVVEIKCVL